MTNSEAYWESLHWQSKRLILLWLFILKTEPLEEINSAFLEPLWVDNDPKIVPHLVPQYVYHMNPQHIKRELDTAGGHPSWTL
jgi:hypothetical protein